MPKKQIIFSACILLAAAAALLWLLRPAPEPVTGGPIGTATLTVSCENLLGDSRADPSLLAAVPADGLLIPPAAVEVLEGDTAFSLLERVCAERGWRWRPSAASAVCTYRESAASVNSTAGRSRAGCSASTARFAAQTAARLSFRTATFWNFSTPASWGRTSTEFLPPNGSRRPSFWIPIWSSGLLKTAAARDVPCAILYAAGRDKVREKPAAVFIGHKRKLGMPLDRQ